MQFIEFLRSLANSVIHHALSVHKNYRREHLYPFLAKITIALQRIIATRWYVSEVVRGSEFKIAATGALQQHLEIVFIFLAFRSILMYFLPQNPSVYGVQRVACNLPIYAKQLRLYLPLLFV